VTCPGSGIEVLPDDDGDVVCPGCQTLIGEPVDPQRPTTVPEHEAPAAARPCLRCQALEAALEQAVTKALEWRDAARLAAVLAERALPIPCVYCDKPVEENRRCYAIPTCYACLPPPPPVVEMPGARS
jgi:hypothetical protein